MIKPNSILLVQNADDISANIVQKYDQIYVMAGKHKAAKNLKCDLLIDNDIYDSYYRAGKIIDDVYSQYVKSFQEKEIKVIIGDENAPLGAKKILALNLSNLIYSFIFAEKFIEQYQIKEKIDLIPSPFVYSLYSLFLTSKYCFNESIVIPGWYINKMKKREFFANSLAKLKILFYPIICLGRVRSLMLVNVKNKSYSYGIHIWDSLIDSMQNGYPIDFFAKEREVNFENSLYIVEGDITENNLAKLKVSGLDVCVFSEMLKGYGIFNYIFKILLKSCLVSLKCLFVTNSKIIITQAYLRFVQSYVLWEIFFDIYKVKLFVTLQDSGNVERVLCQKKHGSQAVFVLWSTIIERFYREDMNSLVDFYYGYMFYDAMISSKLSNDYCKKNHNVINEYIDCGVIRADYVCTVRDNVTEKNRIKAELKIPADKIVVGFCDNTMAKNATINVPEGCQIFIDMYKLLEDNQDYYIVYKSRGHNRIVDVLELKRLVDKFIAHPRVCHVNDVNPKYFAYDIIGVSDVAVVVFSSSALLEAIVGGIPTVCYVPSSRFAYDSFIVNLFENFSAKNYEELDKYIKGWLKGKSFERMQKFQDKFIKPYVTAHYDGKAINRLHNIMEKYIN